MILIGITGPAGAGKDTIADYLVRTHHFEKLSWAAPMKAGLAAMGFPEPANRDDKEKLIPGFPFSWRQAAQRIGTEWGRGLDDELWIKLMARKLGEMANASTALKIVISDVRFQNEAAMLRQRGGFIIHVLNRRAELGAQAGHASELGIRFADGDLCVDNQFGLSELEEQVDMLYRRIKGRAAA